MTTEVIRYLPHGAPMTRKWDIVGLDALGYRVWQAVLAGDCEPNVRSIRERYDASDYAARKALLSLNSYGLVRRWRVSLGRDQWLHVALATDSPELFTEFGPHDRAQNARWLTWLADKKAAVIARARRRLGLDPEQMPELTVPAPVDNPATVPVDNSTEEAVDHAEPNDFVRFSSVDSQPISMRENPLDKEVKGHKESTVVDKYASRMVTLFRSEPGIDAHLYPATRLLLDDGFGAMERANHAVTVASALLSGRALEDLDAFLHQGMGKARDRKACLRWRLRLLRETLQSEKRKDQGQADG